MKQNRFNLVFKGLFSDWPLTLVTEEAQSVENIKRVIHHYDAENQHKDLIYTPKDLMKDVASGNPGWKYRDFEWDLDCELRCGNDGSPILNVDTTKGSSTKKATFLIRFDDLYITFFTKEKYTPSEIGCIIQEYVKQHNPEDEFELMEGLFESGNGYDWDEFDFDIEVW